MYFKCISHLSISYFLSSLSLPPLPNGQNTMCCLPQVLLDLQLRDVSHLRLLPGDYDCGERDDENADHGHLLEMIVLFIKIQYVGSR